MQNLNNIQKARIKSLYGVDSEDTLEKGKAHPDGTIKVWGGIEYIKVKGEWQNHKKHKASQGGATESQKTKTEEHHKQVTSQAKMGRETPPETAKKPEGVKSPGSKDTTEKKEKVKYLINSRNPSEATLEKNFDPHVFDDILKLKGTSTAKIFKDKNGAPYFINTKFLGWGRYKWVVSKMTESSPGKFEFAN
jgi:hypothetical protein